MCTPRNTCIVIVSMLFCLQGWLSTLWVQSMPTDQTIAFYQRILQRHSFDARTYCGLGDAYSRKARESGDVTYFHLAEQALRQALQLRPQYSEALRHLAFVLYARHDFAGAAQEATKAIELDPTDGHAYGVLGDAHLEVGKYGQSQEAFQRMLDLKRDLYAYSRLSGLQSLRGDTALLLPHIRTTIELWPDWHRSKWRSSAIQKPSTCTSKPSPLFLCQTMPPPWETSIRSSATPRRPGSSMPWWNTSAT